MTITPSHTRPVLTDPSAFALRFASGAGMNARAADYIRLLAMDAPMGDSPCHGFRHWLTVLDNALQLIDATPAAQSNALRAVPILFALFHDIRRETEGECKEHGKAGAMLLLSIHRDELVANLGTTYHAISLAAYACECHTIADVPDESPLLRVGAPSPIGGKLTETETTLIGLCLDADRLDLGRVGIRPHPYYLSTQAAKEWAASAASSNRPMML